MYEHDDDGVYGKNVCEMNCMKMMMEQMSGMNMDMNQMMSKMQECDEMMTSMMNKMEAKA